ncbi:MAG: hypothetical protein ABIJ57_11345 [Pseudomonadota bacterium]
MGGGDGGRIRQGRGIVSARGEGRKAMSGGSIRAGIARRLVRIRFVREAMEEKADLALLRAKPKPMVCVGLGLVALSYLIGWPAVGLLAAIAYTLRDPLVLAVGGPLTYGFSHLVFLAGSWLAGSHYVLILLRWTTRRVIEKMGGTEADPPLP